MGLVSVLAGCATLAWYGQAVSGQLDLLSQTRAYRRLLPPDRESVPPMISCVSVLSGVLEIRQFDAKMSWVCRQSIVSPLADLQRPAAVWNVIASPRFFFFFFFFFFFSVTPKKPGCYPIAGCVAYRGYFDRDQAWAAAERLPKRDWMSL